MSLPKVSIIIPVYNVEKYLARCVSSLQNQTLKEIEIILVDDSSTDSSLEICRKLAAEDSRIKVIHKVNEGAGRARNAGLAIATGTYIGFVDSDDFVLPEMYETLFRKAEEFQSDLVMSGVIFVDGSMFRQDGQSLRKAYFDRDTLFESGDDLKKLRMGIIGARPGDPEDSRYGMSIWKNLFRAEIIRKNGLIFQSEREILSEDSLFMLDYISCINRAVGIEDAFYHYFRNSNSISKSYKKDRFEKTLVFVNEVEARFKKDIPPEEYQVYVCRFWQAMCRVICCQELVHAADQKVKYTEVKKRLREICTHPLTVKALKSYPLSTLPIKQQIFAYGMKYRMYFLLKILVVLRSK